MSVSRHTVLERLAAMSDAERDERTTVAALATALDADDGTIAAHVDRLAACELATVTADRHVRVTVTGEELLALDTDDVVIIDPEVEP